MQIWISVQNYAYFIFIVFNHQYVVYVKFTYWLNKKLHTIDGKFQLRNSCLCCWNTCPNKLNRFDFNQCVCMWATICTEFAIINHFHFHFHRKPITDPLIRFYEWPKPTYGLVTLVVGCVCQNWPVRTTAYVNGFKSSTH